MLPGAVQADLIQACLNKFKSFFTTVLFILCYNKSMYLNHVLRNRVFRGPAGGIKYMMLRGIDCDMR